MKLAFLGTGSAYSLERYNGAVVVDGRWLLDGGAPLLPHLHRLGIDPAAIEAVFLTHFHGDHLLGLPPFVLYRALAAPAPLEIVGPAGVEERLEKLFELCWLSQWSDFRQRFSLQYQEAAGSGQARGLYYETVPLDHGESGAIGYRLRLPDGILAYAGDSEPTPPLEQLVTGARVAIIEATATGEVPSHTGWEQAQEVAGRHPETRFFFNHLFQGGLERAARDLEVVEV